MKNEGFFNTEERTGMRFVWKPQRTRGTRRILTPPRPLRPLRLKKNAGLILTAKAQRPQREDVTSLFKKNVVALCLSCEKKRGFFGLCVNVFFAMVYPMIKKLHFRMFFATSVALALPHIAAAASAARVDAPPPAYADSEASASAAAALEADGTAIIFR